jgi:hypothetical protein
LRQGIGIDLRWQRGKRREQQLTVDAALDVGHETFAVGVQATGGQQGCNFGHLGFGDLD